MNRTLLQYNNLDPRQCAEHNSKVANHRLINDMKHDLIELAKDLHQAKMQLEHLKEQ